MILIQTEILILFILTFSIMVTKATGGNAPTDENTLEKLQLMATVDVQRPGTLLEWDFTKLTMEKTGLWILIVDFKDQIEQLSMDYNLSLVLNPVNYNRNLSGNLAKFENPQKEIFNNDEEFLNNANKIHRDYEKESEMYGIYDFKATVMKFERKTKTRQVKFLVDSSVAEYFLKNFNELHRSAVVLEKK